MSYGATMSNSQQKQVDNRGTAMLRDAVRITEETHIVADGTMGQMLHQREQLEGASAQVAHTQAVTKEAHRKITELKRRLAMEKMVLTGVVGVLVAINILLIYRLGSNHGKLFGSSDD